MFKNHKRMTLGLTLAMTTFVGGCQLSQGSFQLPDNPFRNPFLPDPGLGVNVTEPVEFDFDEIRKRGTLRMITRYSSNTYFLHQGLEWGFEYELLSRFAEEHNLALEVIIVGADENPYDLLNSGKGDVIAANYTITPERKKYVKFTRPYNLVDQVIVLSSDLRGSFKTPKDLVENDITISIRRNSSYYQRLKELQREGFDIDIEIVPNIMDTESLLFEISRGAKMATVADDNIFRASNKYMAGLMKGPEISQKDTIAWAIRKNAPNLETELNKFLYKHFRFSSNGQPPKRSTLMNVLRKRYFQGGEQIADYYNPELSFPTSGIISPYDELIKSIADSAGLDWLMISSMVAQETKFNPKSKSWAGAVGLMQVLPRYSEVEDPQLLYDAEINLREGVRIISEHLRHYSYMDSINQWAFALAAYNVGPGHVADARRLAIDSNENPNEWENVAEALLKLMHRRYYKTARYGFCRGIETVRYVEEITSRYETYKSVMALAMRRQDRMAPGVAGLVD